ncbi:cytochrome c-type biogenesis protein [Solimonas marina]|uniref:Cytochrome c-type biogenesis protein n=1 Tax=Solimonas marina TaxID=2714601 RepID=A0A969W6Q0_9GAMM|nr:cytochrome c-type biogenesis protein [Solimonas marina]NKF21671.1 cytochrome c-type biogenesis protein CcmH [Solimonas marina]
MRRLLLAVALFIGSLSIAAAQVDDDALLPLAPLPAAQQARYEGLIHQLRCLVCQNETIADSQAPLAADLRKQVHDQIAAGRSDAQIKRYLTDRYGDFVLYKPPFKAKTWLLWGGPFLVLLVALAVALRFARSRRAMAPATNVDADALQRLLDAERGVDRGDDPPKGSA